jgi:DNA-directed RNA polymerase subunit RPC12/RpoP
MRVLNDYICNDCNQIEEHFLENETPTVTCRQCGGLAKKKRSIPNFSLPGNDPAGFPTAADKWVKKREEKIREESKQQH